MSTNESSRNKTLKVHYYCIICKVTLFFILVQLLLLITTRMSRTFGSGRSVQGFRGFTR